MPDVLGGEPIPVEGVIAEETEVDASAEDSEGPGEPEETPDVQDEDTVEET